MGNLRLAGSFLSVLHLISFVIRYPVAGAGLELTQEQRPYSLIVLMDRLS
jgi:hypothetical protein